MEKVLTNGASVKQRLEKRDGMSMAEFFYPMVQAWDWWHMYETKDIQVQIGGSDQFGNILAGVDAINYIRKTRYNQELRQDEKEMKERERLLKTPMGFTAPLLTTASGEKFGKSAGNAIWLDQEMTSPFDLYQVRPPNVLPNQCADHSAQFFLRTPDADVHRYLKLFTFQPLGTLDEIIKEHEKEPSKRAAQHKLAQEVLHIVHGQEIAMQAAQEHALLFKSRLRPQLAPQREQPSSSTANDSVFTTMDTTIDSNTDGKPQDPSSGLPKYAPQPNSSNMPNPSTTLPISLVYDTPIPKVLYHAGLVTSKSEGHRLCAKGGAYIGSRPDSGGSMNDLVDFLPCLNWKSKETAKYIMDGDLMLIRIGKWKIRVIKIISDDEFERRGLDAPGWKEWKKSVTSGIAQKTPMEEGISENQIHTQQV
ncbi:MAG: hypothetical protein Q9217_003557 [Psora testacea]